MIWFNLVSGWSIKFVNNNQTFIPLYPPDDFLKINKLSSRNTQICSRLLKQHLGLQKDFFKIKN